MPWFRVATEGATTDGRKISRDWITQMAGNYDPKKYGARIWMEHMRGLFHDGPFSALGDVKALKHEEVEDGKVALFADIDPTDRLKAMNKDRQKVYTSIEVNPNFADSGEAYLEGLAVTDSPASLGTDMLNFSRNAGQGSPLAARKQHDGNLFSEAIEIDLDFSEQAPVQESDGQSLLEKARALFQRHEVKTGKDFTAFRKDLEQTLELFAERYGALQEDLQKRPGAEAFNRLKTAHDETRRKLDELYTQLDNEPDQPHRAQATGGNGGELTDC
ncbi:GPO family capsid scaffolding protein [Kushneria phyllosphaerae]|uniref:Phage capsid scaffolding protein (GPO) serine peptidase n=1 Tax=Kushneria phyllosphaerae TaxID=2100822 RepID=A0A2R8CKP0_9GAMM|nr:GPO family capsid scaffolding protein [Kushneria phyllosphaerae]SPJ33413.1 hypothetical protein KSP9073_01422 [Kushneria phyllosphaerae]